MAAGVDNGSPAGGATVLKQSPALYWLFWAGPPLLLMAVIFASGGDRGASGETQGMIASLLGRLAPWLQARLSASELELINVVFRKSVHFGVYGVLALLDARALYGALGVFTRREAGISFAAAVGWAAVDEFQQSFYPSRGGSPYDVLLDATGAVAGVLTYLYWIRRSS